MCSASCDQDPGAGFQARGSRCGGPVRGQRSAWYASAGACCHALRLAWCALPSRCACCRPSRSLPSCLFFTPLVLRCVVPAGGPAPTSPMAGAAAAGGAGAAGTGPLLEFKQTAGGQVEVSVLSAPCLHPSLARVLMSRWQDSPNATRMLLLSHPFAFGLSLTFRLFRDTGRGRFGTGAWCGLPATSALPATAAAGGLCHAGMCASFALCDGIVFLLWASRV